MKKIIAISFAVLIFMSTMGFTFTAHQCGGMVHNKSVSIGANDLRCGMEIKALALCDPDKEVIDHNCCQNESQEFKITDKFQPAAYNIEIDLPVIIAFLDLYISSVSMEKNECVKYLNYHPPLPDRDIPVLIQSFLI